jgi:hypothetical protein
LAFVALGGNENKLGGIDRTKLEEVVKSSFNLSIDLNVKIKLFNFVFLIFFFFFFIFYQRDY